MRAHGVLSIALAAALAAGCADSNRKDRETGAVGTSGADKVSRADRDFVHDAAIANMAEIELGRLASEKAADPEVRKFAQMMIQDHTLAGEKLKAIASQNQIELPANLDEKHQDLKSKLSGKSGGDFDRDYVSAMVDGHQAFVDKLESRIDKKTLSDWKTQSANRSGGTKVETKGKEVLISPESSDDPTAMSINRFAAETYPTAFAHQEEAKVLDSNLKKRT